MRRPPPRGCAGGRGKSLAAWPGSTGYADSTPGCLSRGPGTASATWVPTDHGFARYQGLLLDPLAP